jgi:hypothetical protein
VDEDMLGRKDNCSCKDFYDYIPYLQFSENMEVEIDLSQIFCIGEPYCCMSNSAMESNKAPDHLASRNEWKLRRLGLMNRKRYYARSAVPCVG